MKFHELTSPGIAALDRAQTLAVVPIAAVEQHGPHLPTGVDYILCTGVAEALEARLPETVLLTPTFWLGASAHHLPIGATLDLQLPNHIEALRDLGRSLLDDGFQRLLFLNGHGGNTDPMKVALRTLRISYPAALLSGGSYWDAAVAEREAILEGDHKFVGHACEFETSLMLHLRADLVDESKLHDAGELGPDELDGFFLCRDMEERTREGFTGRPDLATAEKGRKLLEAIVSGLVVRVEKLLQEPLRYKPNS